MIGLSQHHQAPDLQSTLQVLGDTHRDRTPFDEQLEFHVVSSACR